MVIICYAFSLTIPNIGDSIVLVGATANPFIGFIFPALYYIKLDPLPLRSPQKIFAMFVILLIAYLSVLGLITFFS